MNIFRKIVINMMLVFMLFFIAPNNCYAYTVTPSSLPQIIKIDFKENGKILKTGNVLHFTVESNVNTNSLKFMIAFTNDFSNFISCYYNNSTGLYEGTFKLEKSMPEYRYKIKSSIIIKQLENNPLQWHDSVICPDLFSLSFVYSDDCYNGKHIGGNATSSHGKICQVCGTEYEPKISVSLNAKNVTLQKGKSTTCLKVKIQMTK